MSKSRNVAGALEAVGTHGTLGTLGTLGRA